MSDVLISFQLSIVTSRIAHLFAFMASRKVADSSFHLLPFLFLFLKDLPDSFFDSSFVAFFCACRTALCSSLFRLELFAIRA
jgi:hypothetical protein